MSYRHITYENMKTYSDELKAKYAKKADLTALTGRVTTLENADSQTNIIEGVKVNGALLSLTKKIADILVAEGTVNGAIKVNGVDVSVHGLAALAYKSEINEGDLAAALKTSINAKAKQSDLDALIGEGEGSIAKMINDAFNDFSTKVTNDNVVNSYKELIDWAAEHGAEATKMASGISANTTTINNLKTLVGALPSGATATSVVGYIAEAITALSIGDYAKTAEVAAAINAALKDYYTKIEMDTTFVKTADIETVTATEMADLLAGE